MTVRRLILYIIIFVVGMFVFLFATMGIPGENADADAEGTVLAEDALMRVEYHSSGGPAGCYTSLVLERVETKYSLTVESRQTDSAKVRTKKVKGGRKELEMIKALADENGVWEWGELPRSEPIIDDTQVETLKLYDNSGRSLELSSIDELPKSDFIKNVYTIMMSAAK